MWFDTTERKNGLQILLLSISAYQFHAKILASWIGGKRIKTRKNGQVGKTMKFAKLETGVFILGIDVFFFLFKIK